MPRKKLESVRLAEAIEKFFEHRLSRKPSETDTRRKHYLYGFIAKHSSRGAATKTHNLTDDMFIKAINDLADGADEAEAAWRKRKNLRAREGRRPETIKADKRHMQDLIEFMRKRGWVAANFDPLYGIGEGTSVGDIPEEKIRKLKHLEEHEFDTFLDRAMNPRDRALLALNLYMARRVSEIAILRWESINLENRTAQVFNQKKRRFVAGGDLPMHPKLHAELTRYWEWFVSNYGEPSPEWPLFPKFRLGSKELDPAVPITAQLVTLTVRRALKKHGWSERDMLGEGGHTLRRSGGIHAEEHGSTGAAQVLLDHRSLAQTIHYTGNRKAIRELHQMMQEPEPVSPPPAPEPEPVSPSVVDTPQGAEVIDLFTRRKVA